MIVTVTHWRGWMPGIASTEQWQRWSRKQLAPSTRADIDASAIPAMLRRRLSPMGRAVASVLLPLTEAGDDKTPIVFTSRHGEVGRTQTLLQDLAAGELLSPTAFSLSVHNAICGILSINRKITANITAIAAGGDELQSALLEAASLLKSGDAESVLCIFCDEPLPASYRHYCNEPEHPYALALQLSLGGPGLQLLLQANSDACNTTAPCELISVLLNEQASLDLNGWSVQRC